MSVTKNLIESPYISPELAKKAKTAMDSSQWPTTRVEQWKYTRVSKIQKLEFQNGSDQKVSPENFVLDPTVPVIYFLNGHYLSDASSIGELEGQMNIKVLSENDTQLVASSLNLDNEVFNAINTIYLTDGVDIFVPKKAQAEAIQIIHILSGDTSISNFKTIIHIDDFAECNVIMGFFSDETANNCFANVSTEIKLGVNSKLTIDKIQYENENCFHINTEVIDQEKDSTFTINTVTLNGGLIRNNINVNVNGENATTNLYGAYILKGKQHVDNHTVIDHKVAHCLSNELYKGVMDESSTAVFNGKVFVRPDAQKINAFQSNGNVLLSDNASVNSKPELEIYADDVKCSHGSTTGQLDDDALFYLEARGISKPNAMALLVSAFVGEVFENIENEHIHGFIESRLNERFDWNF